MTQIGNLEEMTPVGFRENLERALEGFQEYLLEGRAIREGEVHKAYRILLKASELDEFSDKADRIRESRETLHNYHESQNSCRTEKILDDLEFLMEQIDEYENVYSEGTPEDSRPNNLDYDEDALDRINSRRENSETNFTRHYN